MSIDDRGLSTNMTLDEFLTWSGTWRDGERYELIDGLPVRMASERIFHARVKANAWLALRDATGRRDLPANHIRMASRFRSLTEPASSRMPSCDAANRPTRTERRSPTRPSPSILPASRWRWRGSSTRPEPQLTRPSRWCQAAIDSSGYSSKVLSSPVSAGSTQEAFEPSIRWVRSGGTGNGVSIAEACGWISSGQRGSQSQR